MKLQCPKCGAKTRMPDDSKLILAPGLRDETGLNHYHAYCRQCHHVSDLVGAGCLSALMLRPFECVGVIDPQEIKSLSPYAIADLFGGGGIIGALIEDGVWISPLRVESPLKPESPPGNELNE